MRSTWLSGFNELSTIGCRASTSILRPIPTAMLPTPRRGAILTATGMAMMMRTLRRRMQIKKAVAGQHATGQVTQQEHLIVHVTNYPGVF
jgi:hypothetical protein